MAKVRYGFNERSIAVRLKEMALRDRDQPNRFLDGQVDPHRPAVCRTFIGTPITNIPAATVVRDETEGINKLKLGVGFICVQRRLSDYTQNRPAFNEDQDIADTNLFLQPFYRAEDKTPVYIRVFNACFEAYNTTDEDEVLRDSNGNPILDSYGRVIYTSAGAPNILRDSNGNPILDSYGNPIYLSGGNPKIKSYSSGEWILICSEDIHGDVYIVKACHSNYSSSSSVQSSSSVISSSSIPSSSSIISSSIPSSSTPSSSIPPSSIPPSSTPSSTPSSSSSTPSSGSSSTPSSVSSSTPSSSIPSSSTPSSDSSGSDGSEQSFSSDVSCSFCIYTWYGVGPPGEENPEWIILDVEDDNCFTVPLCECPPAPTEPGGFIGEEAQLVCIKP